MDARYLRTNERLQWQHGHKGSDHRKDRPQLERAALCPIGGERNWNALRRFRAIAENQGMIRPKQRLVRLRDGLNWIGKLVQKRERDSLSLYWGL